MTGTADAGAQRAGHGRADRGLFGPGSLTWRIMGEPIIWVAGLRAMLPPINTLAFATLPRWARRMYGTPAVPLTDLGATVALRMAHQSVTRIPRQLVYLPAARAAHRREREQRRPAAA